MITKNIYTMIFGFLFIGIQAQVGINTDTPNNNVTLDVNGKTNVTQRIYLGGTDTSTGNQGLNTQVILSGGATAKPNWNNKTIPDGFGETFTMTYMHSGFDNPGVDLTATGSIPYTETMTLNDTGTNCTTAGTCWKVLSQLNHTFPVYKSNNKVNFVFQTVVQTNIAGTTSYGCGVFLNSTSATNPNPPLSDFKLVGVRTDVISAGSAGDYKLFNMNVTLENLTGNPGGQSHAVRVACRGRVNGGSAVVGKVYAGQANLNSDMARSALNVFVLESATAQ